jgi:hypothetical protein
LRSKRSQVFLHTRTDLPISAGQDSELHYTSPKLLSIFHTNPTAMTFIFLDPRSLNVTRTNQSSIG